MLRIDTAHFGALTLQTEDVFFFPLGLAGFERCRRWVLLTPPGNATVSWLQAVDCPEAALGVVDPRRFVPDYQLRTCRRELHHLDLQSVDEADVLVTVNRTENGLVLDLKAPLVINRKRRVGRQVVANDGLPVRYAVPVAAPESQKKIA